MDTKKVLRKVFDIFLITVISSCITLVVLVTLIMLSLFMKSSSTLFDFKLSANNSLTDWIIAVSNMLMAIAAGSAAFKAAKWLKEKSSLNHLDTAHKFALEFENKIWSTYEKLKTDIIIRQEIMLEVRRGEKGYKKAESMIFDILKESASIEVKYYGDMDNHKMMLMRYKIQISDRLEEYFIRIKVQRDTYTCKYNTWLFNMATDIKHKTISEKSFDESDVVNAYKELGGIYEKEIIKVSLNEDYTFS